MANFNFMAQEAGNRRDSLRQQEQALRGGLSGTGDVPPGIAKPPGGASQGGWSIKLKTN